MLMIEISGCGCEFEKTTTKKGSIGKNCLIDYIFNFSGELLGL